MGHFLRYFDDDLEQVLHLHRFLSHRPRSCSLHLWHGSKIKQLELRPAFRGTLFKTYESAQRVNASSKAHEVNGRP